MGDPSTVTSKPDFDNLTFGHSFSDHMLRIQWSQDRGWHQPVICKLEDLRIHPGAKVSTYVHIFPNLTNPLFLQKWVNFENIGFFAKLEW